MWKWSRVLGLVLAATVYSALAAVTVRVENPVGSITARVVDQAQAQLIRTSPTRPLRPDDVKMERQGELVIIQAMPADGAPIHLEVELPYGYAFQARTDKGAVTVVGLIRRAEIVTDTGDIRLAVPWRATRLSFSSQVAPKEFVKPGGIKFQDRSITLEDAELRWLLEDQLSKLKITYGRIVVQAGAPGKLTLEDLPFPKEARVKLPWQAQAELDEILAGQRLERRSRRQKPKPKPEPEEPAFKALTIEDGIPRFSSKVRMVNLSVAVFDAAGHPLLGLKKEDFEVIEDRSKQEVSFAGSEEVPFNLVLLLDLSGSTRRDRDAMKEAAARFIDIARPQDRVAGYALANNMFQVVSRLTDDRESLKRKIESIPKISGGSPLYDIVVLSYAEELRQLPEERNALIVISDGIDNRVYGTGAASRVSFGKLKQAAGGINALIYPIFLDPFTAVPAPRWAKKAKANMQSLADATGGRLFTAQSIRDLDSVYPQVADELRSMYTVAYYPENQQFDGTWRDVTVRVKRPGARVRTRAGYFAK